LADTLKQLVSTLANKKPAAATNTTLYTVPGGTSAVLSRILICNQSATPTNFRIALLPAGGSIGNNYDWIAYDTPIAGNDTINFAIGAGLATGDAIVVYNTLATLSFSAYGIEVT
jgi:hypothetical protein